MSEYWKYRLAAFLSRLPPERMAYWFGLRIADRHYRRNHAGREAIISASAASYPSSALAGTTKRAIGRGRCCISNAATIGWSAGEAIGQFTRQSDRTRRRRERLGEMEDVGRTGARNSGGGVAIFLGFLSDLGLQRICAAQCGAQEIPIKRAVENNIIRHGDDQGGQQAPAPAPAPVQ